MKNNFALLIPALLIALGGCAVSTDNTVMGGPAVGSGSQQETSRTDESLPTTVAILPFSNNTDSDFAYDVVRRTMANHFATRNYRWLHWKDVDSRLQLAGFDGAVIAKMDSRELANALGVDGLIYGNITHYDKTFAGIYAQIAVGVELSFVHANGDVIWEVKDVRRSHAGGASTTPVGLLMNALVAGKHLYGDLNLYRAADDLGRALATEIPEPAVLSQRAKPSITNVVHSGVGQPLKYGDTLQIGLEGDPGLTAVGVIDEIGIIDLTESAPGQYVGSVSLGRDLDLDGVVVTGRLQDDFSQTTSWISPYGLLVVDNTPPGPVSDVVALSRDGAVQLQWQAPTDNDLASFQVGITRSQTGTPGATFTSSDPHYTVTDLVNFEPVYVHLSARDLAGNTSAPTRILAIPAPDERFGAATQLDAEIPAVITGTKRLTAAGNPYYLRAESRIETGATLLIGPGVEVSVSPHAKLTVMGELHTFGSADAPVIAKDVRGQGFSEFLVLQTNSPVSLDGLSVTGAGIPVQINAGTPLLANCTLADSQFNAISISGSARPVIRNCTISGAMASGVIIQGQSQPTFEGNRFIDNEPFHLQNGSNYPINASGNTFEPPASNTTVLGDVLY